MYYLNFEPEVNHTCGSFPKYSLGVLESEDDPLSSHEEKLEGN